jgi:uncharacterized protein YndB with AHSA1/START domain
MTTPMFTVERSISIEASPAEVYRHLIDFRRWTAWSPWEGLDPDLHRDYTGAESGPGAVYAWSGNRKAGRGRMEITDAVPGESVGIELVFEKPMRSTGTVRFDLRPQGSGTHVTWRMTGPRPLLLRVLSRVIPMDRMIGQDFEKGLTRLKSAAEPSTTP